MQPAAGLSSAWSWLWQRVQTGVRAADTWQQRRRWSALPVAVVLRFSRERGGQWSALFAHYAFLSLLPVLLVLVTVSGFLLSSRPSWQKRLLDTVLADVPVLGQQLEQDVTSLRGGLLAVVIGLLVAVYGAGGVLRTAHNALDALSATPAERRTGYLPTHWRVILVEVVLLGVTLLAAAAGSITAGAQAVPGAALAASLASSTVLGLAVLLAAFRLLASDRPPWRSIVPGAVAGALGWTALHALGGLYLNRVVHDASLTYGTFSIVIGLLAWLHLQAQIFLLAAALNVVLAGRLWPRSMLSPEPAATTGGSAPSQHDGVMVESRRADRPSGTETQETSR